MTDEDIARAAASDPDNPPLSEEMLARMRAGRAARRLRARLGLDVEDFGARYAIAPDRLRVLEEGQAPLDTALDAYLRVIAHDPTHVADILGQEPA